MAWNAYILLFHGGVPNIGTAPAIQKKIVDIIREDAGRSGKNPYIVVDLGSGEGGLTRRIARGVPEAKVIGLEIARQSLAVANFWRRIFGIKNLEYIKTDFFAYDLSQVDAVVFYQSVFHMEKIGQKLNREVKRGALVISNKFSLGDGWAAGDAMEVKTLYLHQKKLNVYRKQ